MTKNRYIFIEQPAVYSLSAAQVLLRKCKSSDNTICMVIDREYSPLDFCLIVESFHGICGSLILVTTYAASYAAVDHHGT